MCTTFKEYHQRVPCTTLDRPSLLNHATNMQRAAVRRFTPPRLPTPALLLPSPSWDPWHPAGTWSRLGPSKISGRFPLPRTSISSCGAAGHLCHTNHGMPSAACRRATRPSSRRNWTFTGPASNPALGPHPSSRRAALSHLPPQLTGPTGASLHLLERGHLALHEPSLPPCLLPHGLVPMSYSLWLMPPRRLWTTTPKTIFT